MSFKIEGAANIIVVYISKESCVSNLSIAKDSKSCKIISATRDIGNPMEVPKICL